MTSIILHDLVDKDISGVSLFNDSESFMVEITDGEATMGGANVCTVITDILQGTGKMDTCITICNLQPPVS
jgi:hypothetical protein